MRRIPRFFHSRRRITLLLLVLTILVPLASLSVKPGHASIAFKSLVIGANTSGQTSFSTTPMTVSTLDAIVVMVFDEGASCNGPTMTVTDSLSTSYGTMKICGGSNTHPIVNIFAGITSASGSDIVTVSNFGGGASNGMLFAADYVGVTGFAQVGTTQQLNQPAGTFSNSVTLNGLAATSWVVAGFAAESQTVNPTNPPSSVMRQTGVETNCPTGICSLADIPATSVLTWTYTLGGSCNPGLCGASQSAIELTSTQTSSSSILVQCYGNCGTPPITLVNTNSTHTINFNTSIMVLYTFQSNLNGFLLNLTTNGAKANPNNGVEFAIYTIPSGCQQGQTPFTSGCPGLLTGPVVQQAMVKGRISVIYSQPTIPISQGEWVAIALQCTFAPCDFNDTNTNVPLFQANGAIPSPSTIVTTNALGNSKLGFWAWVSGVPSGTIGPPITGVGSSCGGFLDCVVPNLAGSFCNNPTSTCIAESALIWSGLMALFFSFFTMKGAGGIGSGVKLPFGEVFLFWVLVWIFVMSGLGLLFAWVPLFFFFVISLMWGRHTGRYL